MKTIGLIGGMSWESTVTYYQIINEIVKERLGGYHSAKVLLHSVDFHEIEEPMSRGDWAKCADILSVAAQGLEKAGAACILICTNTLHKVAPEIERGISIPILHIAQAVSEALKAHGIKKAALLGTKYTMQQDFYKDILASNGIEVIIPDEADMELINRVIFQELCLGIISGQSKQEYLRIIGDLGKKGAQGVILGCTEIGLLIRQEDTMLPVFDTTLIHAQKAAGFSLDE